MILVFDRYVPQNEWNEAQGKYLTVLDANENTQAFKWKSEFWKTCILHHELGTSQYLITSDEINDDINKCDF